MKVVKSISFAALALSLITALAFSPTIFSGTVDQDLPGQYFLLTDPDNDADPNNYTTYTYNQPAPTAVECPEPFVKVCAIYTDDIYNGDAPAPGSSTRFDGLPKVDDVTTNGQIGKRIVDAKNDVTLNGLSDANDNTVWLFTEP